MTDDSIARDGYGGMAAQEATELRRLQLEVQTDQAAPRVRQEALEQMLVAFPVEGWPEEIEKARYLLDFFAGTHEVQEPRRRRLIAEVLVNFERPLGAPPDPSDTRDVYASAPSHAAANAPGSAGR